MYYFALILSYFYTVCPVIKALPCVLLFLQTENYAFLFAGLGDYFLATKHLLLGLVSFGACNVALVPIGEIDQILFIPFIILQPIFIYAFGWYVIFIDFYVYTLLNMLSTKNVPAILFVVSDIFVLLQFLGYPMACYISLPLYWCAMWMFAYG